MKFKVTVTEEALCRGPVFAWRELMMFRLCGLTLEEGHWVEWRYEVACNWTVFEGELPDTPEAQRAVTELMALAQGHELPA